MKITLQCEFEGMTTTTVLTDAVTLPELLEGVESFVRAASFCFSGNIGVVPSDAVSAEEILSVLRSTETAAVKKVKEKELAERVDRYGVEG